MYLTDTQLTSVRQRPHRTRLWLSVFRPRVILEAQINQADIAKSDRDITVSILSGNMIEVQSGMTVYVGTAQGEKDLGKLRLRSGSGTTLVLAENAKDWVDGWYLTVVRYFEPWGVFPRIILDDDNIPIFYKDWDIAYTDQNEVWDPVVCMGPDDAGFLGLGNIAPTGSFDVWYTSSGSFNPTFGAPHITGSTYGWHFEGGTPTGSTAVHPGMVTYTGVGNFITSLTITTAASKAFTGRRHIRVMARPEHAGSEKPAGAWGLNNLAGDRDSGGWTANVWMREPANPEDIVDGALVVIFSEDYEGGTEVTKIGANAENRGHVLFVGYILEDTISYDPETSKVNFALGGTSAKMAELATYNVAVDDHKADKITGQETHPWTRMPYTTVDRGLIHFLRWHSTVLAVKDVAVTEDGESRAISRVDVARGNLWDSGNQYVSSALGAQLVSDRQGKLWGEINANWQTTGSARQVFGHMQSVIEISRQDWRAEVDIERRGTTALAYLELSGVAYAGAHTGSVDDASPYLSGAPGHAPEYHGTATRVGNLALDGLGQPGLNQLAGNAWADINAVYPRLDLPLAGDYRFLDIAPQHRVEMTLGLTDTWRRIVMNQKPFIPQSMSYEYMPDNQMVLVNADLKEETHSGPGETIVIPVEPPYTGGILPEWEIEFPPIFPPPPEPPIPPPELPENLYAYCIAPTGGGTAFGPWQTRDLESDNPTWWQLANAGSGATGTVTGTQGPLVLDLFDPATTAYMQTSDAIWVSTNLNATGTSSEVTWVETLTLAEMRTLTGEAAAFFRAGVISEQPLGGALATSLAAPGFLATLAFDHVSNNTHQVWYCWTEDVLAGAASWSVRLLDATIGMGSDFGPSMIQVSWNDSNIVFVSCGRKAGVEQNTRLFWTSDPSVGFLEKEIPHTAFENVRQHTIWLPKLYIPTDHTLIALSKRTASHIRISDDNANTFQILGPDEPVAYGDPVQEAVQEPFSADGPMYHIVGGNDANPSDQRAVMRWNPVEEQFDVLVTTADNPPWLPAATTFMFAGYGFWIWPFNENVQLSGAKGASDVAELWFTLDGWETARNTFGGAGVSGGGFRVPRFAQICWTVVLPP